MIRNEKKIKLKKRNENMEYPSDDDTIKLLKLIYEINNNNKYNRRSIEEREKKSNKRRVKIINDEIKYLLKTISQ